VVVVGTANPNEIALIVVSTVIGLLVGTEFKGLLARRAARAAQAPAATPA
jgi:hypothetical protein